MSALTERAAQILADAISKREGNRPFCTLALLNDDGFPYTTTISPARCDGVRTVYFCTGLRSPKVALALREPRACMCFNSDDFSISLAGLISVVSDMEERRAAWYQGLANHFSSPDDPEYCVLRLDVKKYSLLVDWQEEKGML